MKRYNISRLRVRRQLILLIIMVTLFYSLIIPIIQQNIKTIPIIHQVILLCATSHLILNRTSFTDVILMDKLERLVLSIANGAPQTYININIIAYNKEVYAFTEAIESAVKSSKTITYEFISLDNIIRTFEKEIALSRKYTSSSRNSRYYDVTLHIRAHYPKIFTHKKVVLLDLDLEFKCPFDELYKEFNKMKASQIFAIAHDQAPMYRQVFKQFREENKGTKIGEPYPGFPGFNAGLILFDLEKMRRSKEYNYRLSDSGYISLFEKYHVNSGVGDQDFFTCLGAEYPQIYYKLDCTFNRQIGSLRYMDPVFEEYHRCDKEVKIYHFNYQINYLDQ